MIERSGNPRIFALIAESHANGGTMEEWLRKDGNAWELPETIAGLESVFIEWTANQKEDHSSSK